MAKLRMDSRISRQTWPAVLVGALVCGGSLLFGQPPGGALPPADPGLPPPQESVIEVRIEGNRTVPESKIRRHIHTRPGRPLSLETIEDDVRRLTASRMFINVETYSQRLPGGRVVVFRVLEHPTLQKVLFVGNRKIKTKVLLKEVNLKPGDALDPFAVEEGRRKIEEFYRTRGFSNVRVSVFEGDKPGDRRAIFLINEGQKQRILWTSFVGNTIASDSRLRTQVKSKPGILWFFKGEVDRRQIDEDVNRLTAYYRSLGFFRARVGRELQFNEAQDWLSLTFVIDEGPRYRVRNVSFIGNKRFSTAELAARVGLKNGQYFNQSQMTSDVKTIQERYGGIGYVFADVGADPRFLEEPGTLDLVYNVSEGDRYRVGRINVQIKGENPHTKITTVLNRISLKPGDVVDVRELRASERRLRASGLFLVNMQQGVAPKIVFSPPELEEMETELARPPGRGPKVRGQSVDLQPCGSWQWAPSAGSRPGDRRVDLTLPCRIVSPHGQPADDPPADYPPAGHPPVSHAGHEYRPPPPPPSGQPALGQPALGQPPMVVRGQDGFSPEAGRAMPQLPPMQPQSPSMTPQHAPQYAPQHAPGSFVPYGIAPAPRQRINEGIFHEDSPFLGGPPDEDFFRPLDLDVITQETHTGRLMFGVGINSDAGLVGSIVVDEQNFDWTRFPRSWEDVRNATAWRGAGQRFRLEAIPGTLVQRYMVNFQEPYLFDTAVSLGLSGYYYDRRYIEWNEGRVGGRVSWSYRFTHDLSGTLAYRGAKINIRDPIVPTLPELAEVTGDNILHGFRFQLAHDTRDSAFLATEGHLVEMAFEQVTGSFDYPRAEIDVRRYFLMHERPDGSGRHVLSLSGRAGYTGNSTPIYDHYYAGGFSTIRGFDFRGASPRDAGTGVLVGGHFLLLAGVQYMFPITADDMLRAVVFCDTGTVEPVIDDWDSTYRVAPGFGLRISVDAMGPAPIALDFAFPIQTSNGDREEVFSFFVGFNH